MEKVSKVFTQSSGTSTPPDRPKRTAQQSSTPVQSMPRAGTRRWTFSSTVVFHISSPSIQ
jgi:hypothetical protein